MFQGFGLFLVGGFKFGNHTVDVRNPADQLRLVVYPIIYDGFVLHPRWLAGFLPSTIWFKNPSIEMVSIPGGL